MAEDKAKCGFCDKELPVCTMHLCSRCKKHICGDCWPNVSNYGRIDYDVEQTACCGVFICCRKEERDLNKDGLLRVNRCQLCLKVYCENCEGPADCAECHSFFCKECTEACEFCHSTFCKKCAGGKIITTTCCEKRSCCYKEVDGDDDDGVVISVWKKGDPEPKKPAPQTKKPEPDEENEKEQKCSISIYKCKECDAIICDECDESVVHNQCSCRKCGRRLCAQDNCPNGVTFCPACDDPYCSDTYGCQELQPCIMNDDGCRIEMCSKCWAEQPNCKNLYCERYPVCLKHMYFCSCKDGYTRKGYCKPCGLAMSLKCEDCKEDLKSSYLPNANDSDDSFCEDVTPKSSI